MTNKIRVIIKVEAPTQKLALDAMKIAATIQKEYPDTEIRVEIKA